MEYQLPNGTLTNKLGVKKEYPNVAINFNSLGDLAIPVLITPKPIPSTNLKVVVRDGVTLDALNNTVQSWIERDMFISDLLDTDGVTVLKTIAEQENEYLVGLLQKVKDAKCSEIDKTTSKSIVAIAGDESKQRNLQAKAQQLALREIRGTITADETAILDSLELLWVDVETLVNDGNAKENSVQAIEMFDVDGNVLLTFDEAIAAVDVIAV